MERITPLQESHMGTAKWINYEAFTCVPLKKFVITHRSLKKLTAHICHRSELLCSPSHSIRIPFIFHRLEVLTSGSGQSKSL